MVRRFHCHRYVRKKLELIGVERRDNADLIDGKGSGPGTLFSGGRFSSTSASGGTGPGGEAYTKWQRLAYAYSGHLEAERSRNNIEESEDESSTDSETTNKQQPEAVPKDTEEIFSNPSADDRRKRGYGGTFNPLIVEFLEGMVVHDPENPYGCNEYLKKKKKLLILSML